MEREKHKRLNLLCNLYYNELPSDESPHFQELRDLVLEYAHTYETISHERISFIKRYSKVSHHWWDRDPTFFGKNLERVYHYHKQGIEKLTLDPPETFTKERLMTMKSHLFSHASDAVWNLYKQTRNIKFAEQYYQDNIDSAETIESCDQTHALYCYVQAAFVSHNVLGNGEPKKWYPKAYHAYSKVLSLGRKNSYESLFEAAKLKTNVAQAIYKDKNDYLSLHNWICSAYVALDIAKQTSDLDEKVLTYLHGCIADASMEFYERTKRIHWLKRNRLHRNLSHRILCKFDIITASHEISFEANAYRELYKRTKKIKFKKKAFELTRQSGQIHIKNGLSYKLHTWKCFKIAGEDANEMLNTTGDISWAILGYETFKQIADVMIKSNLVKGVLSYRKAAEFAYKVALKTKNSFWADQAIACYKILLAKPVRSAKFRYNKDKRKNNTRIIENAIRDLEEKFYPPPAEKKTKSKKPYSRRLKRPVFHNDEQL